MSQSSLSPADLGAETHAAQPQTPAGDEPKPFATLIATDGRPIRLYDLADDGLGIGIGAQKIVTLDRFQAIALAAAVRDGVA